MFVKTKGESCKEIERKLAVFCCKLGEFLDCIFLFLIIRLHTDVNFVHKRP